MPPGKSLIELNIELYSKAYDVKKKIKKPAKSDSHMIITHHYQ
jgi:hypothetical protein